MADDIVAQLRERCAGGGETRRLLDVAAAEIERVRAQVDRAWAEIEQVRAERDRWQQCAQAYRLGSMARGDRLFRQEIES